MKWTDPEVEGLRAVQVDLPAGDHPGWERLALLTRLRVELDQGMVRIRAGRVQRRTPDPELRSLMDAHPDVVAYFVARHEQEDRT